jgi:hypothetical protein
MNVRTVDGPEASGFLLALDVLEHADVPPAEPWTVQLGMAAVLDGDRVVWFVEDGQVSRLVMLLCACEHAELTTYRSGEEIYRSVAPVS